jgi:cell shape-determining protein MreC
MIYRPKNTKKNNTKKFLFVLLIVVALFFFGFFLKGLLQNVAGPILNFNNQSSSFFGNFISYFKSKNELEKLNKSLFQENQDLKIQILTLDNFKKENFNFKEQLNFVDLDRNFLTTRILTRPPTSPFDTFVISGSPQFKIDQKVFYKNLLIGRLIEVYDKTAVVKLYSSSGEKIAIKLLDNEFEAEGQGNLSFVIKIPKSLSVEIETPIYSFETDSVLGVVQIINTEENAVFQDVYFKYPININKLDYVQVEI